jgi:hypothetical protein
MEDGMKESVRLQFEGMIAAARAVELEPSDLDLARRYFDLVGASDHDAHSFYFGVIVGVGIMGANAVAGEIQSAAVATVLALKRWEAAGGLEVQWPETIGGVN